jgi:chaperonin cofactor prefoldin
LIVDDDRFLRVVGTVLDPQPRVNALEDLADMTERLSKELAL